MRNDPRMMPATNKLHEQFQAIAKQRAHATILQGIGMRSYTYGEIGQFRDRLTHLLFGGRKKHRVCVALDLSSTTYAIAGLLGFAGIATIVPVHPSLSKEDLEKLFRITNPDILLIDSEKSLAHSKGCLQHDTRIFKIDETFMNDSNSLIEVLSEILSEDIDNESSKLKRQQWIDANVAFILPSSGSTGPRKWVPILGDTITASCRKTAELLELTEGDCCLHMLPLTHVHGIVSASLVPVLSGGSILVAKESTAEAFVSGVETGLPTWTTLPPALLQWIATYTASLPEEGRQSISNKHRMRFLRTGAVPMWPALREQLKYMFQIPVIEAYGMTEFPHISCNPIKRPRDSSVGYPVVEYLRITNSQGEDLPIGQVGEVVIRNDIKFPGYIEMQQEMSSDAGGTGQDWFFTGDLGHLDSDGYLYLDGRKDDIINRGGVKISPIEVEKVALDFTGVMNALAFPIPHPTLHQEMVLAIQPDPLRPLNWPLFMEHLQTYLPETKLPGKVIEHSFSSNMKTEKIKRKAIAEELLKVLDRPYAEPQTDTEKRLVKILQRTLDTTLIGIDDSFTLIGGDSLKALDYLLEIQRQYKRKLSSVHLWQYPTVRQLAGFIDTATVEECMVHCVDMNDSAHPHAIFIMPGINGMLFHHPLLTKNLAYKQYGIQPNLESSIGHVMVNLDGYSHEIAMAIAKVIHGRNGSFSLLGYSYGGMLAYQCGVELQRMGIAPTQVFTIDMGPNFRGMTSPNHSSPDKIAAILRNLPIAIREDLRDFTFKRFSKTLGRIARRISRSFVRGQTKAYVEDFLDVSQLGLQNRELMQRAMEGIRAYRPRPSDLNVVLIKACAQPLFHGAPEDLGWREVTGNLRVERVQGNHVSILRKNRFPDVCMVIERNISRMDDLGIQSR